MRTRRRSILLATTCAVVLLAGVVPAMADDETTIELDGDEETPGGEPEDGGNGNLPSGNDPVWRVAYDVDENGDIECWRVTLGGSMTYQELVTLAEALHQEGGMWAGTDFEDDWGGDQPELPRCDDDQDGPEGVAVPWWVSVSLPSPTFEIPPGEAMAGMRAFLVMDHAEQVGATENLPISGALVELEARLDDYEIAWGDPERPVYTTSSRGVPYPGGEGEIVHTYADAGEVTVTVTATWRGFFRIGGGAWQEIPTGVRGTEHSETLEVSELQSVRTAR
jgi:hypothetical protein